MVLDETLLSIAYYRYEGDWYVRLTLRNKDFAVWAISHNSTLLGVPAKLSSPESWLWEGCLFFPISALTPFKIKKKNNSISLTCTFSTHPLTRKSSLSNIFHWFQRIQCLAASMQFTFNQIPFNWGVETLFSAIQPATHPPTWGAILKNSFSQTFHCQNIQRLLNTIVYDMFIK